MGTKKDLKALLNFMTNGDFDTTHVTNELDGVGHFGYVPGVTNTLRVLRTDADKRKKKESWELPLRLGKILCIKNGVKPCAKCPLGEANKLCIISDKCIPYFQWLMHRTNSLASSDVDTVKSAISRVLGKDV